ncbi:MAG: prenyltransferase, partial [Acidimicrobiales bacterium]
AAMALTVAGFIDEAVAAYRWLAGTQHGDGSWCTYYRPTAPGGIEDGRRDTNVCAYVATGVLHLLRATADTDVAAELWPVVERATAFVLGQQRADGAVTWAVQPDGAVDAAGPLGRTALLTGSASTYHSLRCAVALGEHLGTERPDWELAAGRLATAVAFREDEVFEPKRPWAMDWYYPVLCGAVGGEAGRARLRRGRPRFVAESLGVRCIDDHPWYTGAETAECAVAHAVVGLGDEAASLLDWTARLRRPDGGYWTGLVEPHGKTFPHDERSTYTAAAILLADDCIHGHGPASTVLRGEGLPAGLDLDLAAIAEAELDRE